MRKISIECLLCFVLNCAKYNMTSHRWNLSADWSEWRFIAIKVLKTFSSLKKKAKRCTQTLDHNNVAKLQWQVRANCDVFTFDGKCGCKLESVRGHSFFVRFRINRLCSCEDLHLSTWLRLMYWSLTFENRLKLNPVTVFGFSFSLFIMYFFFLCRT